MKPINVKDYDVVATEDVLEVLQAEELSLEDMYAVGVYHARTDQHVPGVIFGRVLVELTRRLALLEDQVKTLTSDPNRVTPRGRRGTRTPPPQAPAGVTGPNCPKCGSPSTLRSAKATGEKFWGCTSFPQCRGTSPYVETAK